MNIFNNAEDIANNLVKAFTVKPEELEQNKDLQQGLKEFGKNGELVGDCPLRIIGAWNSTSELMRQARNRGLLNDDIENGLVLYAQQSAYITSQHRARTATDEQLTDDKVFKFDLHAVPSESVYSEHSDQEVMVDKYSQSSRPYSRTKITETSLRLAATEDDNLTNRLRISLDHMMRVNGEADPKRFHQDCLSDDKYPVHYSRGPNIRRLSLLNNNSITQESLKQSDIETGEHFSEYLNGQWLDHAIEQKIPFLYASVILPDELEIILGLKTAPRPDTSLKSLLEVFGVDIIFTETYKLIKKHYSEHQGGPHARHTSHLSGIFKPDGDDDVELTGTGKEIFYLLSRDYWPCMIDGRLFFSPNGDERHINESMTKMHSSSLWSNIPQVIELLPVVSHRVNIALIQHLADYFTDAVVNSSILNQYNNQRQNKDVESDTDEESAELFYDVRDRVPVTLLF